MQFDRTRPRALQTSTPLLGRAPPRLAPRARSSLQAGLRRIPGTAAVPPCAPPGAHSAGGLPPEPPGPSAGTVTSLGEAGAFTTSLLAPSREAGGEAGARASWLRGLRRGLLAQTSGYRCLQRIAHRWGLGSDCPPPTHTSSALRSLARSLSLKTSKLSGARRAPRDASNSLREHPQR